jgi:iron complex outermembrane receptor protein
MRTQTWSGTSFVPSILAGAALILAIGSPAFGQGTGRIIGNVTEVATGGAVAGAQIVVEGTGIGAVSGQRGTYSIANVPAGPQTLVVSMLGFETMREEVDVAAGETATVDIALTAGYVEMGAITVRGASRRPTRIVEAPAAVSVVTPEEIQRKAIHGQLPKLFTDQPGIDVVQSGVQDFNINARGYNSSLNRRVLVLQDGIDRSVGFLQAQEWTALSMPLEDLGQLELVRGPGSALYGANAFSGVLNITTPAPADLVGTKIAASGGERGTGRFDLRHAGESASGNVGYKANVGYVRVGDSWSASRTRDLAVGDCPATARNCTFVEGDDVEITGLPVEAVPLIDDPVSSLYGSARIDYNFDNGSVWTAEGGDTFTENELFVTGIGRVQINGSNRPWARTQYASDRFTVFGWYSGRRANDREGNPAPPPLGSFTELCIPRDTCESNNQTALASGAVLLEASDLFHVEGQANWSTSDGRFRLIGGGSNRWVSVDTDGTLMEEKHDDTISSLFGQVEYQIHPMLNLLAAARFDHFSVLDSDQNEISPKAALVFSPNPNHSLRFTFNRAFQTPNYSEMFLRVAAGPVIPLNQVELGLEAAISAQVGQPVDLPLNFSPTPVVARGNPELTAEQLTGYEVGWKGSLMGGRAYATADVYYNEIEDFVTDLLPRVNPEFEPFDSVEDLVAYQPAFASPQLAPFAPAVLQALTTGAVAAVAPLLVLKPDGTLEYVLSYANAGRVTESGIEVGLNVQPAVKWEIFGNYTYFDFNVEESTLPGDALLPNTPQHKGNVGFTFNNLDRWSVGASAHLQEGFDWAAGVFAGHVPGYTTVDLNGGYVVNEWARLNVVWTNVFDKQHYQLYGGSVIGSRALGGVTLTF